MRTTFLGLLLLAGLGLSARSGANDQEWEDMYYLAEALYFESRSESDACQLKVAGVILERTRQSRFNTPTIKEVVHSWKMNNEGKKVCQFSYFCDGESDRMTNEEERARAFKNASWVLGGDFFDTTFGADHYYAQGITYPRWAPGMTDVQVCEGHTFGKLTW